MIATLYGSWGCGKCGAEKEKEKEKSYALNLLFAPTRKLPFPTAVYDFSVQPRRAKGQSPPLRSSFRPLQSRSLPPCGQLQNRMDAFGQPTDRHPFSFPASEQEIALTTPSLPPFRTAECCGEERSTGCPENSHSRSLEG